MIPSLDLGIVVLTNAAPVGAAESIAASFTDLAQFGRETRDWYAGYSRLFEGFFTPCAAERRAQRRRPRPQLRRRPKTAPASIPIPISGRSR
ncbi:hypothetical protein QW131_19085 [Roseibium salinum]|nr:hypothetical protein [Roseibium salinum]